MKLHYLEIVTTDVEAVCSAYAASLDIVFGPADPSLGNARTSALPDGGSIGVRAPLGDMETPVVRPYWLVDDIEGALGKAVAEGGEVAHPPLEIPGRGTFAIYILGGVHHGVWAL